MPPQVTPPGAAAHGAIHSGAVIFLFTAFRGVQAGRQFQSEKGQLMPKPGKPIPDGYHSITPYLTIRDAAVAIDFYKHVFGAVEKERMMGGPEGTKVIHAELKIGDSIVMLSDEFPDFEAFSPSHLEGTTCSIMLYVEDCDAVIDRAVAAGAQLKTPVEDMFWGDRMGRVLDPFGHKWAIATHKLDLTPEEIATARKAAGW
jgi:PhnB protein